MYKNLLSCLSKQGHKVLSFNTHVNNVCASVTCFDMKMYCLFGVNGGIVFLRCADHDRPLSKSGKEDAVKVSLKLQQLGWIPELILSR